MLEKHFNKSLADKGVHILDPATGTGTFITEIIDWLPIHDLEYKYNHDLHCNEIALLPYYIANLNIEATYARRIGQYKEFKNIVLMDTLNNVNFGISGSQLPLLTMTRENTERADAQNDKEITVVIGNPPYRVGQRDGNKNNRNRKNKVIDKRIEATYIAKGKSQNAKQIYDLYVKFIRWATERIKKEGMVAFVVNRSFIDALSFDGFRKTVAEEYSDIYIVDLGGDIRGGGKNNVFNIMTGVAIVFFVIEKREVNEEQLPARIHYVSTPDTLTVEAKLNWLTTAQPRKIAWQRIRPDKKGNWLKQSQHDWDDLIAVCDKETKGSGRKEEEKSIFKLYSNGVKTNRDEWVYDKDRENLIRKMHFFINTYNNELLEHGELLERGGVASSKNIKLTDPLRLDIKKGVTYQYSEENVRESLYRPFVVNHLYFDSRLNERRYQFPHIFPTKDSENLLIAFSGIASSQPFQTLASDMIPSLDMLEKTQCLPFYRYENDHPVCNITDFALYAFQNYYQDTSLGKEDIFYYVYAVLHYPAYRTKYKLNLTQELPRIPFYPDWKCWARWGRQLMDLHIGFQSVEPYPLVREEKPLRSSTPAALALAEKAKLKAVKLDKVYTGTIEIDGTTMLSGVPKEAWDYRLGRYSALEWVLERHKEKDPKDETIRAQFHNYRFVDYKESVIELLARVTTVSVETMKIIAQMPTEEPPYSGLSDQE